MSILAIDFGLKKCGLAKSDGFLAKPLMVVPNNKKIFDRLKQICQQHKIEKIIVGLPQGKLRPTVVKFGKNCQNNLGILIEFENEILTTVQAERLLIETGKQAKVRKKKLDAAAAAVILQSYLERQK